MKNLFEAGNFGSISMKEASSDASMEALNDSARLSKDGFMFTNQLYEKLSMERVWKVSILAEYSQKERGIRFFCADEGVQGGYTRGPPVRADMPVLYIHSHIQITNLLSSREQSCMWLS